MVFKSTKITHTHTQTKKYTVCVSFVDFHSRITENFCNFSAVPFSFWFFFDSCPYCANAMRCYLIYIVWCNIHAIFFSMQAHDMCYEKSCEYQYFTCFAISSFAFFFRKKLSCVQINCGRNLFFFSMKLFNQWNIAHEWRDWINASAYAFSWYAGTSFKLCGSIWYLCSAYLLESLKPSQAYKSQWHLFMKLKQTEACSICGIFFVSLSLELLPHSNCPLGVCVFQETLWIIANVPQRTKNPEPKSERNEEKKNKSQFVMAF